MLFSEKLLNAVEAVLFIACNDNMLHRSREVEEKLGMPTRYLEPIFQRLVKADVLKSTRGPGGGYGLAKDAENINVGTIIRALQEDSKLRANYLPKHALGQEIVSRMREAWTQQIIVQLEVTSIADLKVQAGERKIFTLEKDAG